MSTNEENVTENSTKNETTASAENHDSAPHNEIPPNAEINLVTTAAIPPYMQGSGDQLFKGESIYIPPNSNTLVIHQEKYKETSSRYKKKYRAPNPPNITQSTESQSLCPFTSPTTSSSKQIPDIKLSKEAIISIPSELKSSVSQQELIRKSITYGKKRRAPDPPDKLSRIMNSECAIRYQIHRPALPPPVTVPMNSNVSYTFHFYIFRIICTKRCTNN